MLGLGGVLEVCGECYNIGQIDRPVAFILSPPPLYFVFENTLRGMTLLAL